MPIVLAPLVPLVVRLGAVAVATYAVRRAIAAQTHVGRTDQRAEDALDDLGEGLAIHHPADRADDRQSNAAARVIRKFSFRGEQIEFDAALIGRLRIRRSGPAPRPAE